MTDDHPDLIALLRGEASRAEALAATDHLEICEECREQLPATLLAHAMLARSAAVAARPAPLAERVRAASEQPPASPAPPPAAADAVRTRRRRFAAGLVAAAAVGAVAFAGLGGAGLLDRDQPPASVEQAAPAPAPVVASLEPLTPGARGQVSMVGTDDATEMVVSTSLPPPDGGAYYYVWLLDPRTDKLLPVGQVPASGSTTFELDPALVGSYGVIDVSLEPDDGDPAHSIESVLRAAYVPPSAT